MATEAKTTKKGPVLKLMALDGKVSKELSLPENIFATEVSEKTLDTYLRVYLNNQRKGTASTKTRGEVIGSTRKIYRQKGTGGARHGSRKAPIFVGGGVTFGPQPRDYSARINKKQRKVALFSSLTLKNKDNHIVGLADEAVQAIEPKTKVFAKFLKDNKLADKKILIVTPGADKGSFHLATRNIENVRVVTSTNLNAYNVLTSDTLVFVESAIGSLETHYSNKNES
jgi:large subunit ribosomal protein L4